MNKTIKTIYVILLILALILGGCTNKSPTGQAVNQQSQSKDTIKIGGLFHLTGAAAFWGEGEKNAALMAIEEINEHGGINNKRLKLIIEDGQTEFKPTTTAFKKLIEVDKVNVIIGPTWFSQVGSPIAEQTKTVMLSPSTGTVQEPSHYFFALWPTESQETAPVVKHMKEQGISKVAVVYSQNDWSVNIKKEFARIAKEQNIEVVEEFAVDPDESDFRSIITKIKEMNVDAVYAPFAFYPSQGSFSRQAKDLELKSMLYSGTGTGNPILLESFPEIEGTIYPEPIRTNKQQELEARYKEKYSKEASPPVAYAYDAVNLVALALMNGKETGQEVADYLHSIKDYPGATNTITFDENGRITQKQHVIKVVKDGEFVLYE